MDRLTRRMCGGWGLVEGCELNTPAGMRRVVERLATYENTGMTPEMAARFAKYEENTESMMRDLRELANFKFAQADGKIAILPKATKSFKPVVSDDPQDNVSTALNLFYVKDGWTWVRGGGPGPDYADVSLCDYVRQIAKEHSLDIAQSDDDDSISLEMSELLFDGTDTIEGIVATLYTAGWAFAELRERLKAYENSGLSPEDIEEAKDSVDAKFMLWVSKAWGLADGRLHDILQAEKNGRLVVLPVKEGTKIYQLSHRFGGIYVIEERYFNLAYNRDDVLGETIFLTREEAEAALKKREATHGV